MLWCFIVGRVRKRCSLPLSFRFFQRNVFKWCFSLYLNSIEYYSYHDNVRGGSWISYWGLEVVGSDPTPWQFWTWTLDSAFCRHCKRWLHIEENAFYLSNFVNKDGKVCIMTHMFWFCFCSLTRLNSLKTRTLNAKWCFQTVFEMIFWSCRDFFFKKGE